MKNWPKIQYNQVQFGINASLEINEKACDCSLFIGRRTGLKIHAQQNQCDDSNICLLCLCHIQ